jgi:UDP-N-acetylmuramoylalanine--D-glutamate ligase
MPRPGQRRVGFSLRRGDAEFRLMTQGGEEWLAEGDEALLPRSALRLPGRHNAANALAALALGSVAGLPREAMSGVLRRFGGLPHRAEHVRDWRGIAWIDDSKGTNVGATAAAIEGLDGPLVLVAGGEGKGQDFAPLGAACKGKVRHAVLIGRDAALLAGALAASCPVSFADSMEQAVDAAAAIARPGDTVLLSPACASFDMFRDYAHRGETFAAAVRGLPT